MLAPDQISLTLRSSFEKLHGGEYFAHLNGSDIVIKRVSARRWDWTVDGRAHVRGSSNSLAAARVDGWRAGLNQLEVRHLERGTLSIP